MKPISVQLYSLREAAAKDFIGVLKAVSAIGYVGVEPAGLYDIKPADFLKIVSDLGLVVSSNHGPWPNRNNIKEVIDTTLALKLKTAIGGFGPDDFKTLDAIKATADTVNFMIDQLAPAGITLALHNHYWEFNTIDGRLAYDYLLDLCPRVKIELDIYWAANFGACNPAEQIRRLQDRTVLLHVKDGTLVRDVPHVAVGSGKMDIPACIAAADLNRVEWLVVELDSCATDMREAVAASYRYLTANRLARGRI
jgi:sugar phosphate isomerase/epimerase